MFFFNFPDQKLSQKFNPLLLEGSFVPRQRFFLAKISRNHVSLKKIIFEISSLEFEFEFNLKLFVADYHVCLQLVKRKVRKVDEKCNESGILVEHKVEFLFKHHDAKTGHLSSSAILS